MPVRLRSAVYRPVPVTFSLPSCRTNPGAVWTVATPVPSHSYGRRSAARRRILSVGRPAPQPEMGDRLVPGMWRPEMAAEQGAGPDRDVAVPRSDVEGAGRDAGRRFGSRDRDVRPERPRIRHAIGDAGAGSLRDVGQPPRAPGAP